MAVDTYLVLTPYAGAGFGAPLRTESQLDLRLKDLGTGASIAANTLLAVLDYSLDVEQTVNIGSASSGAGAGKIKFNALQISKKIDILSPSLFQLCASGRPFAKLDLLFVRSTGSETPNPLLYLQFTFKLAAVAAISYSSGDESVNEHVTFEYGDFQIRYEKQIADGTLSGPPAVAGWNIIRNVADLGTQPIQSK